jgi:thiamine-monophosphate kinase
MRWKTDRIRSEGGFVISVSDEGEFALIRRITQRLGTSPDVLVGPGDDAAVIAADDGRVVATTDLMVDGRHFRRDWSTAYDVGRKAAASNLADVVAMGGRPTALLVGLAMPADLPLSWVDGLADGVRDEAALLGASVVGGDLVRSETLTIAVTALGDLQGRSPLTRAGARAGDQVVVTGWPGRAAAGLALLEAGRVAANLAEQALVDAHRRPSPDYAAALVLATRHSATAMIDTSDGLVADLRHVAMASRVRIELVASRLPQDPALVEAGRVLALDPFDWMSGGGDDHCFAATVPGHAAVDVATIGRVVALADGEAPAVVFTDRAGPAVGGHEHFRAGPGRS